MKSDPQITRCSFTPPGTTHARRVASGATVLPCSTSRPIAEAAEPSAPPAQGAVSPIRVPAWKRTLDVAFCFVALPALGIVTLCIAVLTRLASRGPIFYRQDRVGLGGRKFKLYKFRTMHVSAESTSHQTHFAELIRAKTPMQKLDARGDARLIPGGRWVRAAGLDELPQILNVLRGEMSLVGPRPCIPYEYDQYSAAQKERFAAIPGLTGLWQVSGKNRTTFEEMVQLDVAYSRSLSPWLDLRIIIMTLPAVCRQIGDLRRPPGEPAIPTELECASPPTTSRARSKEIQKPSDGRRPPDPRYPSRRSRD